LVRVCGFQALVAGLFQSFHSAQAAEVDHISRGNAAIARKIIDRADVEL
jgi:hypothetical protein